MTKLDRIEKVYFEQLGLSVTPMSLDWSRQLIVEIAETQPYVFREEESVTKMLTFCTKSKSINTLIVL